MAAGAGATRRRQGVGSPAPSTVCAMQAETAEECLVLAPLAARRSLSTEAATLHGPPPEGPPTCRHAGQTPQGSRGGAQARSACRRAATSASLASAALRGAALALLAACTRGGRAGHQFECTRRGARRQPGHQQARAEPQEAGEWLHVRMDTGEPTFAASRASSARCSRSPCSFCRLRAGAGAGLPASLQQPQ